MNNIKLIETLKRDSFLCHDDWCTLLSSYTKDDRMYAQSMAQNITKEHFGENIYFRGIIEFSNVCRNDCLYCGIRCSNKNARRYSLTEEEIMDCCKEGYLLGYRTFVLQSGESGFVTSEAFLKLIEKIRSNFPDCAVTLSVGECERKEYEAMFEAGAERYLLRHETADKEHYRRIHPENMSFENRMRCLYDLKNIGFQTGCGMMVGSPYQSTDSLAYDMEFMGMFKPQMAGIGPFLPHKDTPFKNQPAGNLELTLFLVSLTRIMLPDVLMPATTALGTAAKDGRVQGVLAGCNVVMPNLSPESTRKNYMLYDNKSGTGLSAEKSLEILKHQMESINRQVITGRGDHKDFKRKGTKND